MTIYDVRHIAFPENSKKKQLQNDKYRNLKSRVELLLSKNKHKLKTRNNDRIVNKKKL